MRVVPSKKVIGEGTAAAVSSTCFHSSEHSRDKATVSLKRSMSNGFPMTCQRRDQIFHLPGNGLHVGGFDLLHAHIGVYPHHRYVVLLAVEVEPVLYVAALVGVEHQHIRLRGALDAFEDLGQGETFSR
jgi:hypothetical protein